MNTKVKKIITTPLVKKKQSTKTFSTSLEDLLRRTPNTEIPIIVERIVEYIRKHGIRHEGIFRINGSVNLVDKLKNLFDKQEDVDLEQLGDVMAVASLLKLFLRELHGSLIPTSTHYHLYLKHAIDEGVMDKDLWRTRLRSLVESLPKPNYNLLKYLCKFLVDVSLNEDKNRMTSLALSVIFGPNFFRSPTTPTGFIEQEKLNGLVLRFIQDYDYIFKAEDEISPYDVRRIRVQEANLKKKNVSVQLLKSNEEDPSNQSFYYFSQRIRNEEKRSDKTKYELNNQQRNQDKLSEVSILILIKGFDNRSYVSDGFTSFLSLSESGHSNCSSSSLVVGIRIRNDLEMAIRECIDTYLYAQPALETVNIKDDSKLERSDMRTNNLQNQDSLNSSHVPKYLDRPNEATKQNSIIRLSCTTKADSRMESINMPAPQSVAKTALIGHMFVQIHQAIPYPLTSLTLGRATHHQKRRLPNFTRFESKILSLKQDSHISNEDDGCDISQIIRAETLKNKEINESLNTPSKDAGKLGLSYGILQKCRRNNCMFHRNNNVFNDNLYPDTSTGQQDSLSENIIIAAVENRCMYDKVNAMNVECMIARLKALERINNQVTKDNEDAGVPQNSGSHLLELKLIKEALKDPQRKRNFVEHMLDLLIIKRQEAGRPADLDLMSTKQIRDEKLQLQKILLKYETHFGKPFSAEDKEIAKPIYDRYRKLKKLLTNKRSECPADGLMDATISSTSGHERTNFHVSSICLSEAQVELRACKLKKKLLQKELKHFENCFSDKNGRKVTKLDRVPLAQQYHEYKLLKAKITKLRIMIDETQSAVNN
ncbi:Protein FAM13A [Trichoplax sp. H2]|nr:Protein FAM13A [Trichoplax sp. H2]|eukprot:RDD36822.1 Protein FAM13A [Trichoplax sp. H2]